MLSINSLIPDETVKKYNKDVKIILDSHNCETQIMEGHFKKASIGIKKIFLWMEYVKLKRFENYAMSSADKVIVLSEEDKKNIEKNLCKAFECDIIPIGVRKISKSKKDIGYTNCINMLFLGSLTWEPNRAGIVWFVRNVVPKLLLEDIEFTLYIVGKEPGKELVDLTKKHENIHAVGYVDDILEYYDKCDCMIVPLFVGSGQRVKIIEAFSYGMPVITTTIGVEGLNYTDGENVLIADDENSFVKAIKRIKSKDLRMKLSRMSINTYDTFYSENRIGDMIQHSVINCVENKVV